jgi:hypothetical protein
MPDLDVRAGGDHVYDVVVTADDGRTHEYRVTAPASLVEDVGAAEVDEPTVVRRALELLLEHRGGAMPPQFSLAEVEDSYPGFTDQLRAALQPR